jgi:hypothetical protein
MSFDDGDAAGGRGAGSGGGDGGGMNKSDPFFALIYGRDVSGWAVLRMQRVPAAFAFAVVSARLSAAAA